MTAATKTIDIAVAVVLPMTIPLLVQVLARLGPQFGIRDAISFGEVAFTFVSVGIATLIFAMGRRGDYWPILVLSAVFVITIETALAIAVDTAEVASNLSTQASAIQDTNPALIENVAEIRTLANRISEQEATAVQWLAAWAFGLVLAASTTYVVAREK